LELFIRHQEKKKNSFVHKVDHELAHISILHGDHPPKWDWIGGSFKKVSLGAL
jgi:hypothetical protein